MSEALAINTNIYPLPQPQKVFSGDLFTSFIEYSSVKDTTMRGYITCLKSFAQWMAANGITQPVRKDVQDYDKYLAASGYKTGTRQQYLGAVKHFFKWTAAEGLYPNISDNLKGAKVKREQPHKKDPLPRSAVPVIAESIDRTTEQGKRLYAMYLLFISCGLRTVEVSRANVEDMKTLNGITYLYVWGKGHDEPDTPVELPPEVKEAIEDYLASRSDKYTKKSPLFISTSNRSGHDENRLPTKRIAPTTISASIKKLMKGAGFDSDRLTCHSLRHTSNTGAYKATHSLYLTQQHARHVDPATTEIYVHAEEREERHTEVMVYDYYFKQDATTDPRQEAIAIIQGMAADKLAHALQILKAMQ